MASRPPSRIIFFLPPLPFFPLLLLSSLDNLLLPPAGDGFSVLHKVPPDPMALELQSDLIAVMSSTESCRHLRLDLWDPLFFVDSEQGRPAKALSVAVGSRSHLIAVASDTLAMPSALPPNPAVETSDSSPLIEESSSNPLSDPICLDPLSGI